MKYLTGIFLIVTMISCRNSEKVDEQYALMESVSYAPPAAVPVSQYKQVLIYDASLSLVIENIGAVNDSVKKILPAFEAQVSNENSSNYESNRELKMEIRVVEKNFYKLVSRLESLATKTVNHEIDIRDVTGEYIDIEARLKTKKELETRYYEILKQAKTVEDMLEIEKQLGEVRTDIESIESRKKYIDSRASYSTIHLTFSEEIKSDNALVDEVVASIKSGWDSIIQFFLILLSLWPWLLVVSGLIMMVRRWWKKRHFVATGV